MTFNYHIALATFACLVAFGLWVYAIVAATMWFDQFEGRWAKACYYTVPWIMIIGPVSIFEGFLSR